MIRIEKTKTIGILGQKGTGKTYLTRQIAEAIPKDVVLFDTIGVVKAKGCQIYEVDIKNPEKPEFISEFRHGTACDPVIVDGDYAYVTLKGGGFCGNTESGLYVIDISNLKNPELKVIYPMDGPNGLGIKDNTLFICDGEAGLKVYDKTDAPNITLINTFEDIIAYDVIPLSSSLLMIGDRVLYQYEYIYFLYNYYRLINKIIMAL